jgi:hypothetical protein
VGPGRSTTGRRLVKRAAKGHDLAALQWRAAQGHRQPWGQRPLEALEGKLQLPPTAINRACRVPFCKGTEMPWARGRKAPRRRASGDTPLTPSRQGEKATASDHQPGPGPRARWEWYRNRRRSPRSLTSREHMSLGRAPQRLLIDHFVREGGRHPKEQTELFSCVMILCGHLRSGLAEALLRQTSRKSAQL